VRSWQSASADRHRDTDRLPSRPADWSAMYPLPLVRPVRVSQMQPRQLNEGKR
jgi:hypothetical protein